MNATHFDIITLLTDAQRPLQVSTIAGELDMPAASVRRAIRELRRQGYRIVSDKPAGPGSDEYRLL